MQNKYDFKSKGCPTRLGPAISTQKYLNIGGNNLNIRAEQLLDGIWDFYNHYTNFILNNVCQSTVCN